MTDATKVTRTCLIVDDEPRLRQVLRRLMESDGFDCAEAASGSEAVELLTQREMMLVLTDLRMPGMDGIGLLQAVRRHSPDTAVVLITGVSDIDVAVSCLAQGAMDYLTKPFTVEEVRARVRQALEKRRLVIENREHQLRLEERVAEQAHRLERLFLGTLQSFSEALEVKDPYTRGHSVRVSQYSAAIARELRLDPAMVRDIEIGGNLHDIGKIGVREAVLNKPGPLTPEEYEHIMTHPMVGWRILSSMLGDVPVALNIVRSHHERLDGRGMPDGIQGLTIPLEARIAAVADSFDAMTSGRVYRRGGRMSMDATLAEFQRCSGTQFDPTIVAAFTAAVARGDIALPQVAPGTAELTSVGISSRGLPTPPHTSAVHLRAG
jgi:response regulator RpfG family c-di-GMP phosphodiesterase